MHPWKYIVFDFPTLGETVIMFPPHVTHSDMARGFPGVKAVSAGFVKFNETEKTLTCYGKSDSLRLASREDDSWYANKLLSQE